ncbi:MAG: metallophosphoesterase [Oligoflexia bacterium]|nr:metallophosphoesterase [Oligoflexia bacterium]
MISEKLALKVVIGFAVIYGACTNLEIDGVTQRFWENMNSGLRTFPDLSVANPTSFSFAAMGDTHIGSSSGGNVMARALQNSRADGDAFAVIAGDDSNTGIESELTTFMAQINASNHPVYPAIGNHDIFFGGWNNYKRIVGRSIYSFNVGNAHIIMLDSANGTFGEDQLNWLRNDLKTTTKPIKIIVTHFPIFSGEFSTLFKLSSDEEATVFKSIMREYSVKLVIGGHYHGYSEQVIGGTRYLVTGACNNILDIGNRVGYVKVVINGSEIAIRQVNL